MVAKGQQAGVANQEIKDLPAKRETLKTRGQTLKPHRKKPIPTDHMSYFSVHPVFLIQKGEEYS